MLPKPEATARPARLRHQLHQAVGRVSRVIEWWGVTGVDPPTQQCAPTERKHAFQRVLPLPPGHRVHVRRRTIPPSPDTARSSSPCLGRLSVRGCVAKSTRGRSLKTWEGLQAIQHSHRVHRRMQIMPYFTHGILPPSGTQSSHTQARDSSFSRHDERASSTMSRPLSGKSRRCCFVKDVFYVSSPSRLCSH